MLNESGIESQIVQVVDNNEIDREVSKYRPTHVIIEALWVVPDKFDILEKLHPNVRWIVRCHSEIPFLANEGIAIEWIKEYIQHPNVIVASNSTDSVKDIRIAVDSLITGKNTLAARVIYLPNYYPVAQPERYNRRASKILNVACLGAIRPLKNQLIQAVAAIEFANRQNLSLNFHINSSRNEQGGENNLKNIEALFAETKHRLIKHEWLAHDRLLSLIATMDLSMNVSLSETFNIIAADSVSQGIPVVCSPEIEWTSRFCQAQPTSSSDIVQKMFNVTNWRTSSMIAKHNLIKLQRFSKQSREVWLNWILKEKYGY
jgi:hypothetical protein